MVVLVLVLVFMVMVEKLLEVMALVSIATTFSGGSGDIVGGTYGGVVFGGVFVCLFC